MYKLIKKNKNDKYDYLNNVIKKYYLIKQLNIKYLIKDIFNIIYDLYIINIL